MTIEQQQLELLHQIRFHLLNNTHAYLLYLAMALPLPVAWQLKFYYWVTSLHLPELSAGQVTLLVIFGPIIFILSLYLAAQILLLVVKLIVRVIALKLRREPEKKILLHLIFPAHTDKSAYATEQLYKLLHTVSRRANFWDRILGNKSTFSLEIVSTKKEGIRFFLAIGSKYADIIKRNLYSYLPGIQIKETDEYLPKTIENASYGASEFVLSNHFALSLENLKTLSVHDPISYITGNMTKLSKGDLITFQVVVTPVMKELHREVIKQMDKLRVKIYKGEPLAIALQQNILTKFSWIPGVSLVLLMVKALIKLFMFIWTIGLTMIVAAIDTSGKSINLFAAPSVNLPQALLNPYEKELSTIVKEKIDQPLFETSIRVFVQSETTEEVSTRLSGITATFGQLSSQYQSLVVRKSFFPWLDNNTHNLITRSVSQNLITQNPILSVSELSDLFHFPYTETTKTEDMAKVHSTELPSPLSLKNMNDLDVMFGKNTFEGQETLIGLTDDDRSRHAYIIGQTGSGKSTILYHMAKDDIQKGRGVAVIDPHGDLAEDLLATVPENRIDDCIYFNPFDLKYPIGINLLELTPGLIGDDLEQEKELVCESVVSIFRRVFTSGERTDSHRIEYILRNAIHTAFAVPNATIFTVYNLLNDPSFQKKVTQNLEDEQLRNFWKNEFGRAGNYQIVKMVSGVTAKVGRFLFSPTAKRILEQPKSTINFDEILSSGKILICNLAEGKLGEDTSQLLGTTIIAKLQLAAMRRIRTNKTLRTPFYLFIDEFQNFATSSFSKLLSGGRKFGLRLTIAEQSTTQQDDRNLVNTILANTGTVICFRTASPVDEQLMLSQFAPYVVKGQIGNLPRYHFYMKLSAIEPEEPFSGITLPISVDRDELHVQRLIESSRKNFASVHTKSTNKIAKSKTQPKKKKAKDSIEENKDVGTLL